MLGVPLLGLLLPPGSGQRTGGGAHKAFELNQPLIARHGDAIVTRHPVDPDVDILACSARELLSCHAKLTVVESNDGCGRSHRHGFCNTDEQAATIRKHSSPPKRQATAFKRESPAANGTRTLRIAGTATRSPELRLAPRQKNEAGQHLRKKLKKYVPACRIRTASIDVYAEPG